MAYIYLWLGTRLRKRKFTAFAYLIVPSACCQRHRFPDCSRNTTSAEMHFCLIPGLTITVERWTNASAPLHCLPSCNSVNDTEADITKHLCIYANWKFRLWSQARNELSSYSLTSVVSKCQVAEGDLYASLVPHRVHIAAVKSTTMPFHRRARLQSTDAKHGREIVVHQSLNGAAETVVHQSINGAAEHSISFNDKY